MVYKILSVILACITVIISEEIVKDDELKQYLKNFEQPELKVTKQLDIGEGATAWVIDNAIRYEEANQYMEANILEYRVNGLNFGLKNYTRDLHEQHKFDEAPWSGIINLNHFGNSSIWKNLEPVVKNLLESDIKIQQGKVQFVRATDPIKPNVDKLCAPNRYVLTLYFHDIWKLNSYGQVSFYTMRGNPDLAIESRLEITETVHPHAFRGILWPSCHTVLFRSPSVNIYQHLIYLNVWITTDLKDELEVDKNNENPIEMKTFRFTNEDANRDVDLNKHVLKTYYDRIPSRPIQIFDDVFTTEELRAWRSHLHKFPVRLGQYDPTPLQDHDNVQYMSQFDVDSFLKTDMWPRLQNVVAFVSNESDWHPYDVALNYVRHSDHTRIHPDSELHQEEYTMLLYLTEGLTPSDFGETVWMVRDKNDDVHQFIGDGGEIYHSIAAVSPKFGRLVVFKNNIEHSAHPPSPRFLGGRYSFAVKVARSERLSLIKQIYENMETLELSGEFKRLAEQLQLGYHDDENRSTLTMDDLRKVFTHVKKEQAVNLLQQQKDVYGEHMRISDEL